jgi:hypothetical protein
MDLRLLTKKEEIEHILTVFVIVFEVIHLGSTEYLEVGLPGKIYNHSLGDQKIIFNLCMCVPYRNLCGSFSPSSVGTSPVGPHLGRTFKGIFTKYARNVTTAGNSASDNRKLSPGR